MFPQLYLGGLSTEGLAIQRHEIKSMKMILTTRRILFKFNLK